MSDTNEESQLFDYLLDDLDASQRYEIERRYLENDEYFDLLCAAEENLIVQYLDGKLGSRNRARFEEIYSTGAQAERVRTVRLLRDHFSPAAPQPELSSPGRPKESLFDGLLWFVLSPCHVLGAADQVVIDLSRDEREVRLELKLNELEKYAGYEATLQQPNGPMVLSAQMISVTPSEDGSSLYAQFPSQRLTDGDYILNVAGTRENAPAEDLDAFVFTLRSLREAAGDS